MSYFTDRQTEAWGNLPKAEQVGLPSTLLRMVPLRGLGGQVPSGMAANSHGAGIVGAVGRGNILSLEQALWELWVEQTF